jgi:hypothetical protein
VALNVAGVRVATASARHPDFEHALKPLRRFRHALRFGGPEDFVAPVYLRAAKRLEGACLTCPKLRWVLDGPTSFFAGSSPYYAIPRRSRTGFVNPDEFRGVNKSLRRGDKWIYAKCPGMRTCEERRRGWGPIRPIQSFEFRRGSMYGLPFYDAEFGHPVSQRRRIGCRRQSDG